MVTFRDARRGEVPQLIALLADDPISASRETPGSGAYWAAFDAIEADPRNRLIVGEADGQPVAMLQLTTIPSLARGGVLRAQIEGVHVAAGQRGKGLGTAIISWAMDQAREAGCGLVQLTSDKRRTDAIRFYQSLGFEATHEGLKAAL